MYYYTTILGFLREIFLVDNNLIHRETTLLLLLLQHFLELISCDSEIPNMLFVGLCR